jgi:hypothetical protein
LVTLESASRKTKAKNWEWPFVSENDVSIFEEIGLL